MVAIKVDLLDEINTAMEGTGLQTSIVGHCADGSLQRLSLQLPRRGRCSLLLDIGARTTNILFIEGGRIFLREHSAGRQRDHGCDRQGIQRIISGGGNSQKTGWLCRAGCAYAETAEPNVARVSKITRSTMTRLHAELMRSITHYRAQQQGNRPARIFLCPLGQHTGTTDIPLTATGDEAWRWPRR